MSRLDRVVIDPQIAQGQPTIRGTRMRVSDVLALLAAGADEAEILADYPYLEADEVRASLEYAAAQADHGVEPSERAVFAEKLRAAVQLPCNFT